MGNSHKPHKIRHHSKKRGGALEENTDFDEVDVGEMEAEEPVKPVAVKNPVPAAAKPAANAPVADAPVAKGKCCPCPDENKGLLQKLNPKNKLDDLEAGILNTHALVGKFGTAKKAELTEGLKGKIFDLTSKINKTVGNKEAPAPAAVKVAQPVEEQTGGRRRRRRTSKVKKGRKSKKRGKSKKVRKTKRTRKTKHY